MVDFLKENLRPSSVSCVLALLTPGAALLFVPAMSRWVRRWITIVLVAYLLLSTQAGAGLLARTGTPEEPEANHAFAERRV